MGPMDAAKPPTAADAGVAEAVVTGALLAVAENGVGLGRFLELLFGRLVAGIAVERGLRLLIAELGQQFHDLQLVGARQLLARCHGIEAISGGIAPDLRLLDRDCMTQPANRKAACIKENDEYYATTVRKGRVRNGAVYMPPFDAILQQEAVWAIKADLETRREKKP